jgi:hypothetical protein
MYGRYYMPMKKTGRGACQAVAHQLFKTIRGQDRKRLSPSNEDSGRGACQAVAHQLFKTIRGQDRKVLLDTTKPTRRLRSATFVPSSIKHAQLTGSGKILAPRSLGHPQSGMKSPGYCEFRFSIARNPLRKIA